MRSIPQLIRGLAAPAALAVAALAVLVACGGGGGGSTPVPPPPPPPPPPVNGPAWPMFSGDAQHSATSAIATPPLTRIIWQTPVDLAPQYSGPYLLTHYGSPVISGANTVLVPVKTGANGGFRIDARNGANGTVLWTANSDYIYPPHNWLPSFNLTITGAGRMYAPGAGGKLLFRDNVDAAAGALQTAVFYGANVYNGARAELDAVVMVSTPITVDSAGNAWFGFFVTAANSANLSSGVARIAANGTGTWQAASVLANDNTIDRVAMNSAPALSADGATLYVGVANAIGQGYLLALDSSTLAPISKILLLNPGTTIPARITGDSTSSPVIGPDGDVYYGVLASTGNGNNNSRGWLLHYNSTLSQVKTPGAFGWDNTPSIVSAASVPSYAGTSTYLLATKYNNYAGAGTGDGLNRMAILDPSASQVDPISGQTTMKEVFTVLGPTADPGNPGGRREWCVNTAAFDPATKSLLVNNEDGFIYRWDLATNMLSEKLQFNNGVGQSYTPTAVGPDGTVFAINNAVLFAVGR